MTTTQLGAALCKDATRDASGANPASEAEQQVCSSGLRCDDVKAAAQIAFKLLLQEGSI